MMRVVTDFIAAAENNPASVTDGDLARVMTAAVKLYAARTEASGTFPPPIDKDQVSATEALTVITELMRAVDVNMFEVSMWHGRAEHRS